MINRVKIYTKMEAKSENTDLVFSNYYCPGVDRKTSLTARYTYYSTSSTYKSTYNHTYYSIYYIPAYYRYEPQYYTSHMYDYYHSYLNIRNIEYTINGSAGEIMTDSFEWFYASGLGNSIEWDVAFYQFYHYNGNYGYNVYLYADCYLWYENPPNGLIAILDIYQSINTYHTIGSIIINTCYYDQYYEFTNIHGLFINAGFFNARSFYYNTIPAYYFYQAPKRYDQVLYSLYHTYYYYYNNHYYYSKITN